MEPSSASPDLALALRAFKADLKARGFYHKPTARILCHWLLHLLTATVGTVLLVASQGFWPAALGFVLLSAGEVGVATATHTAAHFAVSRRRWINQTLTYLGYPLFLGLGATYWWEKHNVRHHSAPNVIGIDDDIAFLPWFAYSQADVLAGGRWARRYYRVQWLLLLPLALFLSAQMQLMSIRHLLRAARSPRGLSPAHRLDAVMLALYWTCWVVLPLCFLPVLDVLGFTLLRLAIMSVILFVVFAPAHIPQEASVVQVSGRGTDPFLLQTSNTLNFRAGPVGAWLISGLQYQVEHHLFPAISHVHYPQLSPLVAAFCERHGYPYRSLGWGEALWKTLRNFVRPKEVTEHLRPAA